MPRATFTGVDAVSVTNADMLVGLTDLAIGQGPSGPVLYATGRGGSWLTSYDLGATSGDVTLQDSWELPNAYLQLESTEIVLVQDGNATDLLLAGLNNNDMRGRAITGADFGGTQQYDAGAFDLGTISTMAMTPTGDVAIAAVQGGGLVQLNFGDNDTITVSTPNNAGPLDDQHATALTVVTQDSTTYAVAVYGSEDRISLLRMTGSGDFRHVDRIDAKPDSGLWIDRPAAVTAITGPDGQAYVIVAASGSDSISVLKIDGDDLIPTEHVLDTLDTRFADASYVEAIEINGQPYVVVAGTDQGISVLMLEPGGRLSHVATVAASVDVPINGISAMDVLTTENGARIFIATQGAPYLVEFEFTLDNPGQTVIGDAGNQTLSGTNGDDLIFGDAGHDSLVGGSGDDRLIDGAGRDSLRGNGGEDTFVLRLDGEEDRILDFQRGSDRIDIESPNAVADINDVVIRTKSWGAEVEIGTEILRVYSASGQSLTASDLLNGALRVLPRISVDPTDYPDPGPDIGPETGSTLAPTKMPGPPPEAPNPVAAPVIAATGAGLEYGTTQNDSVKGSGNNDQIFTGQGHDVITGRAGSDILMGAAGSDTIKGGQGDDSIDGGSENDSLIGSSGDDVITGGSGLDFIIGSNGHDSIWGGADADDLRGGNGNDWISAGTNYGNAQDSVFGGNGNDTIFGDIGFDLLKGGDGRDLISGGDQADNLYGDVGNDTLFGGQGFDRLFGGTGNDLMYGGDDDDALFGGGGRDTIWGGAGDDRFYAQGGKDVLDGGAGNDVMSGGSGLDTLIGGEGNDTMWGDLEGDRFVFDDGHGHDQIKDFDAHSVQELLDFSQLSTLNGTSDVLAVASQQGADVVIVTGANSSIRLENVNLSDLDAADFLF
ncbi:MAG: hypothetical protein AAFW87_08975 [Pseudomonadota bacterium]